ncbi:hypothetical protein TNCT_98161 [Trichonephila clavata]|uniref:Uncharacterized protein n=1 Tax=Trichonephila clavata TaxID=2740835 RepID=A0A8X6GE82_TRICU|nr:hypothetical protein TNCT_98161 [Trichonephila clavata]
MQSIPSRHDGRKQRPHCIYCSLAGICGVTRLTDYCASKFAAVGFEECLRLELYDEGYTGIHSTVVCPFFINTGMFDGANSGIFAMLEPEYVADEIVASVLVNKEVVIIPSYFLILVILKTLAPAKMAFRMGTTFELDRAMHGFKGRQKTD